MASQGSGCIPNSGTLSGLSLVTDINAAVAALISSNSGTSAPATDCTAAAIKGQLWLNTSTAPNQLEVYDGSNWVVIASLDLTNHLWLPVIGGGVANIASASTVDLGSVPQTALTVTGTTTITGFGSSMLAGQVKVVTFAGALTLTYNATSMILPAAANYTTAAGDMAIVTALGSGNFSLIIQKANGQAVSSTSLAGFRNRLINGDMRVDQRNLGASQTITAGAAWAYTVDRWEAASTGANVTGQRVVGTGAVQNRYQFTGAASVTAINFNQRIEAANSYDLASSTVQLCADLADSTLTSVTWAAYYANSADTFGTLASPAHTSIASGTFTVTSSISRYCAQISVPSAATTGIEVTLAVGAQVSGTWLIGNVQLEQATSATVFEKLPIQVETQLCLEYAEALSQVTGTGYGGAAGQSVAAVFRFAAVKRVVPTVTVAGYSGANFTFNSLTPQKDGFEVIVTSAALGAVIWTTTGGTAFASAEL